MDGGFHMVKSMPHLAKGLTEITGWSGARCARILREKIWQGCHFLMVVMQSLKIVGQKYPARNIFWVVASPDK